MEKLALQGIVKKLQEAFSPQLWRRIWAKDWLLKGVSLFLATLLWYYVGGEETVDKNVMMPIEIINLPRDLVISNQFKKEIEVTVSGPRSRIEEMADKAITRQINLADAMPGTNVIENDNDSIDVPKGITVLRIQPSSIILSLDKLIQKQFPVIPVTTGDAALGYTLKNMRMDPDAITITGPETILSQVDELLTDIIDINDMTETRQLQVPLDLEPAIVELIGETSVTAEIIIQPQVQMKKLDSVPVDVSAAENEKESVMPVTVEVIANFPILLIREKVDLKSLFSVTALPIENSNQYKVEVIPRKDNKFPIEILSVIPDKIELTTGDRGEPSPPSREKTDKKNTKDQTIPFNTSEQKQTVITVQPVIERNTSKSQAAMQPPKKNENNTIQIIHPTQKKIKKD